MDTSVLQEITRWLTKIAAAGITILPLLFLVAIIKSVQQLDNLVGNIVSKGRKGAEGAGDNIKNRRDINAANGTGIWGKTWLGANRRRRFRRNAKAASLSSGAKHASENYTNEYAQENERYAKQLAGGMPILEQLSKGKFGAPGEAALDRVLAGTKFNIEKVEAEEIKAAHATIDLKNEGELLGIIRDGNTSNTKRAAALERLVQVGGMKSIEEAVNTFGKGVEGKDGIRETTESRALAGALQKDGPGWLKASDIDNIRRGKLGQTELDAEGRPRQIASNLEQITVSNLASGALSPAKMAAANTGELEYASEKAQGNTEAQASLRAAADRALDNETTNATIKHNRKHIESLLKNSGTILKDSNGNVI